MRKPSLYLLAAMACSMQFSICFARGANDNNNPITMAKATGLLQSSRWAFEENKGQVTGDDAPRVKFMLREGGLSLFLMDNGITYQFSRIHYPEGYKHPDKFASHEEREKMDAIAKDIRIETHRMDVTLKGANPDAKITTEGRSADYIQYYNHNALDVHSYSGVTYHDVYPNIDWVIYQKEGAVKYDFVVRPGGDPSQIQLQTNWVEDVKLNADGSLKLINSMGTITEQTPVSFQNGKEITTRFVVKEGVISFELGNYNSAETLVIDPALLWATYYGGTSIDAAYSCSSDDSGNVYLAGATSSTFFIASTGHQNTLGANSDGFLVKFNNNGVRQWATYYGGTQNDNASSCGTDASGNVFLAGETESLNNISSGGFQNNYAGGFQDAFLVKFNSSGVRQWATYYGGNESDHAYASTVDDSGNVFIAGSTRSSTSIASNGHQNIHGGDWDAFLVKFNNSGTRQWATYYGDTSLDWGNACVSDTLGNVFLVGNTASITNIASNGHQNSYAGGTADGYIVKFSGNGVRQWASYYGGSDYEEFSSCATDDSGCVYLAGGTRSSSGIASGGHQNLFGGGTSSDAFLVKLDGLGVLKWATYYGTSAHDWGVSCATDVWGNVYLSGISASTTSIASGGIQNTSGGFNDAFLVKFNNSGVRNWGTYYGGANNDEGRSCTVNSSGNVFLAGRTWSTSGIASGGHQNIHNGGISDGFLAKFFDSANALPIKFLDFSATYHKLARQVNLTWLTTSEVNNDYFTIDRSKDGKAWEELAQIKSTGGSSNTDNHYAYADQNPYKGKSYYRLKQTDLNGSYEYAPVRTVFIEDLLLQSIYPNPAYNLLHINAEKGALVEIYSTTGQLMDRFTAKTHYYAVDVSRYPSGVYFVSAQNVTMKFVKE